MDKQEYKYIHIHVNIYTTLCEIYTVWYGKTDIGEFYWQSIEIGSFMPGF